MLHCYQSVKEAVDDCLDSDDPLGRMAKIAHDNIRACESGFVRDLLTHADDIETASAAWDEDPVERSWFLVRSRNTEPARLVEADTALEALERLQEAEPNFPVGKLLQHQKWNEYEWCNTKRIPKK
jgi:hypothetical protein